METRKRKRETMVKELQKLQMDDNFGRKPAIKNPYISSIATTLNDAVTQIHDFVDTANQGEVLNFAYKAKMLAENQHLRQGIDEIKTTLADFESAEASTSCRLSNLVAIEVENQTQLSTRLNTIDMSLKTNNEDIQSLKASLEAFGSMISQIEQLEQSVPRVVSASFQGHMDAFAAEHRESENRTRDELLSQLKATYSQLSDFSDSLANMREETSSINSRLEEALATIPRELHELRDTLRETKPLDLSTGSADVGKQKPGAPRMTQEYEEWREYYITFTRMHRRTSMADVDFVWLFLDHVPNDELALQIQRNLCSAKQTKAHVKLRRKAKGKRKIDISPTIKWEDVKAVVKVARPPFAKYIS